MRANSSLGDGLVRVVRPGLEGFNVFHAAEVAQNRIGTCSLGARPQLADRFDAAISGMTMSMITRSACVLSTVSPSAHCRR